VPSEVGSLTTSEKSWTDPKGLPCHETNHGVMSKKNDGVVNPKIPFVRNWIYTAEVLNILRRIHPNHEFITRPSNNMTYHPHVVSAVQRAIVEEQIVKDLLKNGCTNITDIGGNALRHSENNRDIHSCCPILSPKDSLRNMRYNMTMDYCINKAENCSVRADGYMSVHSLYYLKPQTVLELVHRSTKGFLIAAVHDFSKGYGQMHFNGTEYETSYQIINPTTVLMTSLGNDGGPYSHSPCFWLKTNYYQHNNKAIAWGYRHVGDTLIYTFRPAPINLQPTTQREMTLIETIKNDDFHGEVIVDNTIAPLMNYLNITKTKFISYGPLMWAQKQQSQLFVPKGLIHKVAFQMVGKQRNRDTWLFCIKTAKNELDPKKIHLPDSVRSELAIYVPAMAFLLHLEDEIMSFNRLVTPRSIRLYAALNSTMNLTQRTFSCFSKLNPCRRVENTISTSEETSFIVDEYNNNRTSKHSILSHINKGAVFLSTTTTNILSTMRDKSYIKLRTTDPDKEDILKIHQVATTFTGHIPVVPTNCQTNTVAAIVNRVLKDTPEPVPGSWESMTERFHSMNYLDYDSFEYEEDELKAFMKWNSTFEPPRQRQHIEAYNKLKETGMQNKDYYRKMFVKIEKLDKSTEDKLLPFNPRGIQGVSHEANVVMGPFMRQYAKELARQWNGKDHRFYYTSGATGEDLGRWMHNGFNEGDLIVEVDFTMYDGTQSLQSHNFEKTMLLRAKMGDYPNVENVYDNQKNLRGFSNDGVEYFVPNGRCSGDPNTSCGNSGLTIATTDSCLAQEFGDSQQILIAGMGDDNTSIIPGVLANGKDLDDIRRNLISSYAKFGFVAKVKIHTCIAKAEFCSGVFWPVRLNGRETYVLGPKPGRIIPKMGYSIKPLTDGEIKGMFIGYHHMGHYVPIMNTYVDSMLKKMNKTKCKRYVDHESQYKICYNVLDEVTPSDNLGSFFLERYNLDYNTTDESLKRCLSGTALTSTVNWLPLEELRLVDA
jgi:hypothetical protein